MGRLWDFFGLYRPRRGSMREYVVIFEAGEIEIGANWQ
jgi:hypothetical protein